MREHPILFSGPMVQAILAGRKTQTRRPVTRLQGFGKVSDFGQADTQGYDWAFRDRRGRWNEVDDARMRQQLCPFGVAGEQLWVRETFKDVASGSIKNGRGEIRYGTAYQADGATIWKPTPTIVHDLRGFDTKPMQFEPRPWRPSIHMPRRASRLRLGVEAVRLEQLHSISGEDAEAEGIDGPACAALSTSTPWRNQLAPAAVHAFAALWDSVNGAGAWLANPWVWVITFRRVTP